MTDHLTEVILGPPGTGKTTTLIDTVGRLLSEGMRPNEIAYLAFTKRAADEAVNRALDKFPQYSRRDFPFFRTIHSLCFRQLGLSRQRVMQPHHYRELGEFLGLEIRGTLSNYSDEGFTEAASGDKAIFIENVARNRCIPLEEEWERADNLNLSFDELDRFKRALSQYKDNKVLVDYTDMLSQFLDHGMMPRIKALIVDEAQDLSQLQWRVINEIRGRTNSRGFYCGDDDQSIYRWAGADTLQFQSLEGSHRTLERTYRVPRLIKGIADQIIRTIGSRIPKSWLPTEHQGSVEWATSLEDLELGEGSWYLIGRNLSLLREFEDLCRQQGVPYETGTGRRGVDQEVIRAIVSWTKHQRGVNISEEEIRLISLYRSPRALSRGIWHDCLDLISLEDREYYISCLRRGEDLRGPPRVRISTIHGVKGGEADHVVVLTDMTRQTFDGYMNDPDEEARVFYVAVTRARKSLTIVSPGTNLWFNM